MQLLKQAQCTLQLSPFQAHSSQPWFVVWHNRHRLDSRLEGSMASPLKLSVDGAVMHQGHGCSVDELGQPTCQAASSMQPPLLCNQQDQ